MIRKMKQLARSVVRNALGARENETLKDVKRRNKVERNKAIDTFKYGDKELLNSLRSLGIKEGDTIIVHASWRPFYNYKGDGPTGVIAVLRSAVGETGTLLMPSYGADLSCLDVNRTKSNVGVLSEVFWRQEGVRRALVPHFTLAGCGPAIDHIFSQERKSSYGFDDFAPYSLAIDSGAKILLMGLGEDTAKISAFHRAGWLLREENSRYATIWGNPVDVRIVDREGNCEIRSRLPKRPGVHNDDRSFRKAFSLVKKKTEYLGKLDLIVFDGNEAVATAVKAARDGLILYKGI